MAQEKKDNPHAGHRMRLRQEYAAQGMDHFPYHKVLEMLLFYAIPQRDTNELGHKLIETFGSFSRVFAADVESLAAVKGMNYNAAVLIHMIPDIYRKISEDQLNKDWILNNDAAIAEYLKKRYDGRSRETVMLLCLDNACKLQSCTVLSEGDSASATLDFRKLSEHVLRSGCHHVILAHNHPGGICRPSTQDIRLTEQLARFLSLIDIQLLDHFILTENECRSMAKMGLINQP